VRFQNESIEVRVLSLARLVAVKTRVGRAKDRAMLPLLIALLDEEKKRGG
jgi:hypothetical protein